MPCDKQADGSGGPEDTLFRVEPSCELHQGDRVEVLRQHPDCSIDAVVTDPPYGVTGRQPDVLRTLRGWMGETPVLRHGGKGIAGKPWDSGVPEPDLWRECIRVLKPGGHVLSFGSPTTFDLAGMSMRLAGLDMRPHLIWLYGQGMPKSLNVSKSVEKRRPDVDASRFNGMGTGVKPAHEPILWGQKPVSGTITNNAVAHGTGIVNIDGTRIGAGVGTPGGPAGRWPASVTLSHTLWCKEVGARQAKSTTHYPGQRGLGGVTTDGHKGQSGLVDHSPGVETVEIWECAEGCPIGALDAQSGVRRSGEAAMKRVGGKGTSGRTCGVENRESGTRMVGYGDAGTATRFFYCAKPSKAERHAGIDGQNVHPTVKPVELMRWLIRLVTPPGGTVLDPHIGSGTTAVAAVLEGFDVIGIDSDEEGTYLPVARQRVAHAIGSTR